MESAGCWGSYSVLGMGKAWLAGRALVGGVRFSVSGWTKCPEVGQGAPHYSTFELFMVDTILLRRVKSISKLFCIEDLIRRGFI